MLDPIVREIEVPCSPETAFDVFVSDMASWWPVERFSASALSGQVFSDLRVQAREGGTITEVAGDGSEHLWGRVTTYDRPDYLAMDFHIVHPDQLDGERGDDDFTLVEVHFRPVGDGDTNVRLTQSNWEALGDMAALVRGGYGTGWTTIFEKRYREACGG